MNRLSGSGLRLVEACPASAHLAEIWMESDRNAAAGTGRHAFMEDLQSMPAEEALARVPEGSPWKATCEAIDPAQVPAGRAEVGYAYHVPSGEVRELTTSRHAGGYGDLDDEWITGTVDLIVEAEQRVIDWKGVEPVDHPAINIQLGFYGLVVSRYLGWDTVKVGAIHIHPDGHFYPVEATLEPWDIARVEDRVRAIWSAARGASVEVGPYQRGLHCTRCSSLAVCPAAMTVVRELVADPELAAGTMANGLAAPALALVYERATVAEAAMARLRRGIEDRVHQIGDLALPGGGGLRVREITRKNVKPHKVLPILRERYGPERVNPLVDEKITNGSIEKLAKGIAPKREGTKYVEGQWSALIALGAVTVSSANVVQCYRAKPHKGGGAPDPDIPGANELDPLDPSGDDEYLNPEDL